jgi:hypothetical protein
MQGKYKEKEIKDANAKDKEHSLTPFLFSIHRRSQLVCWQSIEHMSAKDEPEIDPIFRKFEKEPVHK